MSVLSPDKNLLQLKPFFLPTPFWIAQRVEASSFTQRFNIGQNQFGALATKECFKALQPHLLEIDIQAEIAMLKADRYLEIILPILNLTDLASQNFKTQAQKFPCVVGINGFGAKDSAEGSSHFSRSDFMSIIDLIGNQYEIMVHQDGQIELPQEGTGRFTIFRKMIWVYSAEQVQGRDLQDLKDCHLNKNSLYVLPPIETIENFSLQIAVVDLSQGSRKVESLRTIKVAFKDIATTSYTVQIKPDQPNQFCIETTLPALKRCMTTLNVKCDGTLIVGKMLDTSWLKHPIYPHMITKRSGLSYQTQVYILRQLYTQCDLMKDYLQEDNFGLVSHQGYNHFLLHPESFEAFYDLLLHHVAYYKQGDFIFDRIPAQRIVELDLLDLPVDFHDSVVLMQLQEEISANKLTHFKKYFTQYQRLESDVFFIETPDANELPEVSIDVFYEVDFLEQKIKANLSNTLVVSEKISAQDLLQLPSIDIGD